MKSCDSLNEINLYCDSPLCAKLAGRYINSTQKILKKTIPEAEWKIKIHDCPDCGHKLFSKIKHIATTQRYKESRENGIILRRK